MPDISILRSIRNHNNRIHVPLRKARIDLESQESTHINMAKNKGSIDRLLLEFVRETLRQSN